MTSANARRVSAGERAHRRGVTNFIQNWAPATVADTTRAALDAVRPEPERHGLAIAALVTMRDVGSGAPADIDYAPFDDYNSDGALPPDSSLPGSHRRR